jgi:hypothetical protein
VEIEAVRRFQAERKQFQGKARSEKLEMRSQQCKAGSEKPEVGCHILPVGGCRETEFSGKIRPNPATRFAFTN